MTDDFSMTICDRSWASTDHDAIAVTFRTEKPFHFTPGQYVRVRLLGGQHEDENGDSRIFNVASPPSVTDRITIITRLRGSAYKKNLLDLPIGSPVFVSQPFGDFALVDDPSAKHVFLIGGTGIAPILSMLQHLKETDSKLDVSLFYSNKTIGRIVGEEVITTGTRDILQTYVHTLTQTNRQDDVYEFGRIDENMITGVMTHEELCNAIFYVSGPWGMGDTMREVLHNIGVPDERIHVKEYDLDLLSK